MKTIFSACSLGNRGERPAAGGLFNKGLSVIWRVQNSCVCMCVRVCACVCMCVCMFMWFMRTQICIMTWV